MKAERNVERVEMLNVDAAAEVTKGVDDVVVMWKCGET